MAAWGLPACSLGTYQIFCGCRTGFSTGFPRGPHPGGGPARALDPPDPSPPLPPAAAPSARNQEKREALLAGAARLFNEQGVRGATLAGIAASAGLVTNSVTHYFRKKEDLATACFMRTVAAYGGLIRQAATAPDVAARVRALLLGHARLIAEIEAGTQAPVLSFNDVRALPSPHWERVSEAYNAMFRELRALLQGPETAAWGRDDLNARSHLLLSLAHGMRRWVPRHDPEECPRVAHRLAGLLLHGMAGAGARWADRGMEQAWVLGPLAGVEPAGPEASDTTESFLRAATFLVNEQGFRGASVDKISARLNVTKGSFYHHHDTKQDLISACFARSLAVQRQAFRQAADATGTGWERAGAAARALSAFQLGEQGPLLRASALSALPDAGQRAQVQRTMERLAQRVAGLLVDGLMDGSLRPLDPALAAEQVLGMVNSAAELRRWVPAVGPDTVAGLYVRPLFMGLLCAPQAGGGA